MQIFPYVILILYVIPDSFSSYVSPTRRLDTTEGILTRTKRYVIRKKRWKKNELTWRLEERNINEQDRFLVRNTLHRAFREWESVSSVRFSEKAPSDFSRSDVTVAFEKGIHQDAFPFDGPDGVVAHAFYPRDGRLHFDADEQWTLNSPRGVNLFQTAVHEIGHLLGLEHSTDPRAAMLGAKRPFDPEFTLGDDDVRAIRVLFPLTDENGSRGEETKVEKDGPPILKTPTLVEVVENLEYAVATTTTEEISDVTSTTTQPEHDRMLLSFPFALPGNLHPIMQNHRKFQF